MNLTVTAKNVKMALVRRSGGMADAHGSGPCGSNTVWVQVPSSALQKITLKSIWFQRFFGVKFRIKSEYIMEVFVEK